jgi:MFS family permease
MRSLSDIVKPLPGSADRAPVAPTAPADWRFTASYTLGFLTLISSFNYLDRSILGLALPLIKSEMRISDTALGLVSGLAFALCYSLLGVPIAWLADRVSRRNIIAAGFAFWSLMTVMTGWAANVWQLAACRFLMSAGEACGVAPSNAMLSDVFRPARQALALAVFATANSLALIVFFPLVGWIGQDHGWRAMFIAAGIPGVLLAPLFFITLREPARGALETATSHPTESLRGTVRSLAGCATYRLICLGATFMGANIYAASAWYATFLQRMHRLSLVEIAATIGPLRGILGGLGILAGGILTDRLGRRDIRWRLLVPGIACLLAAPGEVLFLFGRIKSVWLFGLGISSLFMLLHQGPAFAAVMHVTKVRMRAVAISVALLFAGLFGQVLGPFLVGFLNDRLHPMFGDDAIRYSLLITAVLPIGAGCSFLAGVRHIARELQP